MCIPHSEVTRQIEFGNKTLRAKKILHKKNCHSLFIVTANDTVTVVGKRSVLGKRESVSLHRHVSGVFVCICLSEFRTMFAIDAHHTMDNCYCLSNKTKHCKTRASITAVFIFFVCQKCARTFWQNGTEQINMILALILLYH